MDFGFLATANSITGTYFNQTAAGRSSVEEIDQNAQKQFSDQLNRANDAVESVKEINVSHKDYASSHTDPLSEHAARLGFSIDNRVFDMLGVQIPESMNSLIKSAMDNAMGNLEKAM